MKTYRSTGKSTPYYTMDTLNRESFLVFISTMNTLLLWLACEAFLSYITPICVNGTCAPCGTNCKSLEMLEETPKGIFEEKSVILPGLGCGVSENGNWNCVCDSFPCFIPLPPLKDTLPSPKIVRALRDSPPSRGESYWKRSRANSYEEMDEQFGQNDTPFFGGLVGPYISFPPLPPSPDELCS